MGLESAQDTTSMRGPVNREGLKFKEKKLCALSSRTTSVLKFKAWEILRHTFLALPTALFYSWKFQSSIHVPDGVRPHRIEISSLLNLPSQPVRAVVRQPVMADASTRPNSTVYVGGLHPTLVTASVLSEAFIPFGEIADISLPKPELPSSTDLHRGFGYVEFEEAGDAKEAINNMDQSELYRRVIKVAMAKPQRKEDESGGLVGKTAIWEQVSLEG
jgi:RNA recognition motif. (a.k.a. RRM, RBD, or RNP domain)